METDPSTQEDAAANPVPNETPIPVIAPEVFDEPHRGGSAGSVIAILLIVFLLVIGAFYVWGQRLSEQRANEIVPATGS